MPRIAIVDTYYGDFLNSLPPIQRSYDEELRGLLNRGFGTADFYSHNLKAYGWEVLDIVANYEPLQRNWAEENGATGLYPPIIAVEQIIQFKPDVVFLQDLSFFDPAILVGLKQRGYLLAAQISCPMPPELNIRLLDCVFSSFPHYVERFRALGVQAEYLPLAFDPRMLVDYGERLIDISFVGGIGRSSHWAAGTDALEQVAKVFGQRFSWWGYGRENVGNASPLAACYRGTAWGREMYGIYGRSKIVVNRHGEVAQGYANNLRMFEATGMGAMLMTEAAPNLNDLFPADAVVTYENADELCARLEYFLHRDGTAAIAERGQKHTLTHHTYAQRMAKVSEVLNRCLEGKAATV